MRTGGVEGGVPKENEGKEDKSTGGRGRYTNQEEFTLSKATIWLEGRRISQAYKVIPLWGYNSTRKSRKQVSQSSLIKRINKHRIDTRTSFPRAREEVLDDIIRDKGIERKRSQDLRSHGRMGRTSQLEN